MKKILSKAGKDAGMCLDWMVVSCDPDCVSDFGCDCQGFLTIADVSFPLKIEDITNIRYRWDGADIPEEGFLRFNFGEDIYLDCCFNYFEMGYEYHIKYFDKHEVHINKEDVIKLLNECINKKCIQP